MSQYKIRTLVVDDSVFYRGILSDVLKNMSQVDYIGNAPNGSLALAKIAQSPPDLVTLDVEMPEMDGLEVLERIKRDYPSVEVVMISAATHESAQRTITALEHGALDFIEKPNEGTPEENERNLLRQLRRIIRLAETKLILKRGKGPGEFAKKMVRGAKEAITPGIKRPVSGEIDVVVIGVSTGGPQALPEVLERLPKTFHLPIVIVQHLPPTFVSVLVESLNRKSQLTVTEAMNNRPLLPGVVYLAPGDFQTKIAMNSGSDTPVTILTKDPPENFCRPSVDYLFRSAAEVYHGNVLAVIMTGMGKDGLAGLKLLKSYGATTLAQNEASSVVFGMAMEAIDAKVIDQVLPLDEIAGAIENLCGRKRIAGRR